MKALATAKPPARASAAAVSTMMHLFAVLEFSGKITSELGRTALASACRRNAKTLAAQEALAQAVAAADPSRAAARLAVLREALAAPTRPTRLLISHPRKPPSLPLRDARGRFLKALDLNASFNPEADWLRT